MLYNHSLIYRRMRQRPTWCGTSAVVEYRTVRVTINGGAEGSITGQEDAGASGWTGGPLLL